MVKVIIAVVVTVALLFLVDLLWGDTAQRRVGLVLSFVTVIVILRRRLAAGR